MPRAVEAIPDLRLFRRNIGFAPDARVRFGVPGQADVYGYLARAVAIPLELELKAHGGRLSEPQKRWRDFCFQFHIPYFLLEQSANETPDETVNRWVSTLLDWTRSQP